MKKNLDESSYFILQEHTVLRHLDNLPKSQGQKPAEFTLADLKDVETSFSEVRVLYARIWSMEMLTLPNSLNQTQKSRDWSNN